MKQTAILCIAPCDKEGRFQRVISKHWGPQSHDPQVTEFCQQAHQVQSASFPSWLLVDLPDKSAAVPSSVITNTDTLLPESTARFCEGPLTLLRDKLSPERLLPLDLLSLSSGTLLKQRLKLLPLQEVFICFNFLKIEIGLLFLGLLTLFCASSL